MSAVNEIPEFQGETQAGEVSLADILTAFQEYLWLIVAIVALAGAAAYYIIRTTPVSYKSTGTLLVELKNEKLLTNIQGLEAEQPLNSYEAMNTLAVSMVRTEMLRAVALRIANEKYVRQWSLTPTNINEIAARLRRKFDVEVRRQSRFIDVSAMDGDPSVAQAIAQALMEEYLDVSFERRQGTGQGATNFLSVEADKLRRQLELSEAALSAFVRTNSVSVRGGEDDLVSAELQSLNQRYLETKTRRLTLETDWEQIETLTNQVERLLAVPSVVQLPNVAAIRERLLNQQSEIAKLELRYKEKHPLMIEARQALESVQDALFIELRNAPNGVLLNLKKAQLEESQLEKRLREQEQRVAELAELRMVYDRLNTTARHHRDMYEALRKRESEAKLSISLTRKEGAQHNVTIFEMAKLPGSPFQPDKRKILVGSLALGLGFALGLVYIIQMLDRTLRSVDQAENVFGVPVLGAIPKSAEAEGKDDRLVVTKSPDSHASEGFRTLRAAVSLLGREGERKVTMFTSAVPAEGKTFCSSNFAMATAQSGKRTVIVDFDLRRPSVGKTFGIDMAQEGVSDCLLGKTKYDEVMVPTENAHLFVIPAGTLVPNPSELIASPHTQEFLDELKSAFDHVVVDNAPVTAVSDTLMIVGMVDTVCLVTKAAKTSIRVIGRAIELVRRAGVNPAGLVLNFITKSRGAGYKYYYYSDKKYAGGYAGGYGSHQRKQARS